MIFPLWTFFLFLRFPTQSSAKLHLVETSEKSVESPLLDLGDDVEAANVTSGGDYQGGSKGPELYELPIRRRRRRRRRRRKRKLLY